MLWERPKKWQKAKKKKIVISFSSGIYPEVELLDHVIVLFLILWGISILFSVVAVPIYIPNNNEQEFPLCYILTRTALVFLIIALLTGVRWYRIVVLLYIFLVISHAVPLFLLVMLVFFLKKRVFVYSNLLPIFKLDYLVDFFFFFAIALYEFPVYFGY